MFKIGFLEVRVLDVLDVLLVALLLYQLYRLLRGSVAFNIVIVLLLIYLGWFIVRALKMNLLSDILGKFVGMGMLAVLVVFQPEVRRFLLFIGRGRLFSREWILKGLFARKWSLSAGRAAVVAEIARACGDLAASKTGALIVFPRASRLHLFIHTGVQMDAKISADLLRSIFAKDSPLHDGAVIIGENRVLASRCILPVSDEPDLPSWAGMRHRAAVGVTEHSDATALVVSEESGEISYARNGRLHAGVTREELNDLIGRALEHE